MITREFSSITSSLANLTKKGSHQDEYQDFEDFDWLMRPLTDYLELQHSAFSGEGELYALLVVKLLPYAPL